ncbi:MAG: septum formation initiator family protein [Tissierellia bacterium]|nr:septum formation initiator family protein [Tissierellia bacterium]
MAKRRKKRKRSIRLFPLALLVLLAYGSFFLFKSYRIKEAKKAQVEDNKKTIEALEEDIKSLEEEIDKSDSIEYAEEVARDDLGMVKPKEVVFIDKNKKAKE